MSPRQTFVIVLLAILTAAAGLIVRFAVNWDGLAYRNAGQRTQLPPPRVCRLGVVGVTDSIGTDLLLKFANTPVGADDGRARTQIFANNFARLLDGSTARWGQKRVGD